MSNNFAERLMRCFNRSDNAPSERGLQEFMKSVEDLAYDLANPPDSVDYKVRKERIKNALREAYISGYTHSKV